jgi:urease accessory protein
MLRLHGVMGRSDDPQFHNRLHALEHAGGIEHVHISEAELGRRRFRLTSDKGTDCAISLDRDEALVDGAVLLLDDTRAVIVRLGEAKTLRLRPSGAEAALQLGWNAGNLHWRVRCEGGDLVVLLDGPASDYRARVRPLLDAGLVEEIDGR